MIKSMYQDQYYRWHDKKTNKNDVYSSNNAWIYTAYAAHILGNTAIDNLSLKQCYNACSSETNENKLIIDRHPGIKLPPMSKDEIIGLISLGLLSVKQLKKHKWNFCNLPYKDEGFLKALISLFKIRKEHRNYAWQNNLTETYSLLFSLPFSDRHYALLKSGLKSNIFYKIAFYLELIHVILINKSASITMLKWLQLKDLNLHTKLIKPPIANYFQDVDHPFRNKL